MVRDMPAQTADDLRKTWGDDLYMERCRLRLSQQEVADQAGLSRRTIGNIEDGTGSLDAFLKVAKVLDIALAAAS